MRWALAAWLLALGASACGELAGPAAADGAVHVEARPRPVEHLPPPPRPEPYCGDGICDWPVEDLVSCTWDCWPEPINLEPEIIFDPGFIDPPWDR